jgi:small subunit ribosomal protein S5
MTQEIKKDKKTKETKVTKGNDIGVVAKKETGDLGEKTKNISQSRDRFKRDSRKPRMEFDQKIVSIRRVTRVVAGGRRFSFSVCIVIGDKKGSVGVGMGKASDTALAIEKAYNNAKNSMIKVSLKDDMSIPHIVKTKFTSSEVFIKPAPGKGVIAGGSVRTVLELAGITDVNAKIFSRSKNDFNNAKAAIKALSQLVLTKKKLSTKKTK